MRAFIYFGGMMDNIKADAMPERAHPKMPKPFPGLLVSIGWIILYFALQGLCIAIAAHLHPNVQNPGDLSGNPEVILWGASMAAVFQMALMFFYLRKENRLRQIGLTHFGHLKILPALGLALFLVLAAMIFNAMYSSFVIPGIKMQAEYQQMIANLAMTPVNIAAGIFVVVVAAPVVEELLFRGFLQKALANHLPIWVAIGLSSLTFALVHGQLYAIPGLMSLSIAFGYLYHRTGSLRTNILLHMANNAFTLAVSQALT